MGRLRTDFGITTTDRIQRYSKNSEARKLTKLRKLIKKTFCWKEILNEG
jgi:hypothetical protein